MVRNEENGGWQYLAREKLSVLLHGITLKQG